MLKSYKYRLYPNKEQEILLNKHFGSMRFIYNLALETKIQAYVYGKSYTCFDLHKQLTDLKQEIEWLNEINSQSLQQSITNLDTAFKYFFKNKKGFPNFKSKKGTESFQVKQSINVDFETNKLYINKFREGIKCIFSRQFTGNIKQCTISKNKINQYFVSILVENDKLIPVKNIITSDNSIGLDLGITDFVITSDGLKIENNKFYKSKLDRINILQNRLNKKKKGSKNRNKARLKLAKQFNKLTNTRNDFYHKLTTKIVTDNQGAIIVENLNIKGMSARCKPKQDEDGKYLPNGQAAKSGLNKSIQDVSWGIFTDMLKYKCEWYGKTYHEIGRFDPSSKTCSNCGKINKNLSLNDREWKCESCGITHDRDINAAINIKTFGLKSLNIINSGSVRPVVPVEMLTLVKSVKQESQML